MKFLIQKEKNEYSLDNHILLDLIKSEKLIHEYKDWSLSQFLDEEKNILNKKSLPDLSEYIPLGDIPFTESFFSIFYNINKEMPIEIPEILRTNDFLKRKYSIRKPNEIPTNGNYFIKDVSQLKQFSYAGDLSFFMYDGILEEPKTKYDTSIHLKKNHLYQVSEIVPIMSEYRVFVLSNEIYSIANYDGDVKKFPDIKLIQKAVDIWSIQKDCPKSYSMDVAITPFGTIILECHILFSTGIYNTVIGSNFLYGYRDAKDYILKFNTPIKEWSNFS